jgi:hypothetical protein
MDRSLVIGDRVIRNFWRDLEILTFRGFNRQELFFGKTISNNLTEYNDYISNTDNLWEKETIVDEYNIRILEEYNIVGDLIIIKSN